jgi:hypothetical protein
LPFATGPPFVYEPLLSERAWEAPFEVLPRGDLSPEARDDPLV